MSSAAGGGPVDRAERLVLELEVAKSRPAGWAVFGLLAGAVLVWKFGTVFKYVGVILLIIGAWSAVSYLRIMQRHPGKIVVGPLTAMLPAGLCQPVPSPTPISQLSAAYFLRTATPWPSSAPVLVIEANGHAYLYPRDWFANEASQRRLIDAVQAKLAARAVTGAAAAPSDAVTGANDADDADAAPDAGDPATA